MTYTKFFFNNSDLLDHFVLRPLAHIQYNWELTWDGERYEPEEDSYADSLNSLINDLGKLSPPSNYHDNEDRIAEYAKADLQWNIYKSGNHWHGAKYDQILEVGGLSDIDQTDLMLAAVGRINAAIDRNQSHFDEMEESHREILAAVMTIILYYRI